MQRIWWWSNEERKMRVVERSFIKHMDVLINILFGGYVFEYVKIVLKLFDGNDVKVEEKF